MESDQSWAINPNKLPQRLEIELSAESMERLRNAAIKTGRSEDELILEILDQAVQDLEPGQKQAQD
jgi:predicted DNA-binding protein